jgi:putative SOS response-associated peptidase YedK
MCGRYTLRRYDLAWAAFDAIQGELPFDEFSELRITPRFNIAPSQMVATVRINSKGERVLSAAKWGLIPSWAKSKPKTCPINARAETLASSGMFRQAFKRRRCLIPADGFYEWQGSKPPKQPYFIHRRDDRLFGFGGLWERWNDPQGGEVVDTCTIITTPANELMAPIRNRMPLILAEGDYARWLDREIPGEQVEDLLKPSHADLEARPISTAVNSVKNDRPELIDESASS